MADENRMTERQEGTDRRPSPSADRAAAEGREAARRGVSRGKAGRKGEEPGKTSGIKPAAAPSDRSGNKKEAAMPDTE